jgi:IS5 family transposase
MLVASSTGRQTHLFGADRLQQLDPNDPFAKQYYQGLKPIRLMAGLLILKQLENLSAEAVGLQFKRNPYFQVFCGFTEFSCNYAIF